MTREARREWEATLDPNAFDCLRARGAAGSRNGPEAREALRSRYAAA
jgi:hypothetical protein